jgi:cytochrome c-type biogenesis protein CcmH/NrfG
MPPPQRGDRQSRDAAAPRSVAPRAGFDAAPAALDRVDGFWIAVVVGLALLLRLIYLLQLRDSPYFAHEIMDAAYHDMWAREIAAGKPFAEGSYFRAPLYFWFLGLLYKVSGTDYFVIRLVQSILGSLSCGLVYLIGRRALGRTVSGIAALACSTYWILIYFDGELLLTALTVFLYLLVLLALMRASERPTLLRCAVAGLLLGVSALARPNILLFAPFVAGWLLLLNRPSWREGLRAAAVFCFTVALAIAPVTVRNWIVGNEFVLIASHGGLNLYIGNNPQADGMHVYVPGLSLGTEDIYSGSAELAQREAGRALTPSEVSRHFARKATEFILGQPVAAARLMSAKLAYFWSHREILNNKHIYLLTERYTPVVAFLPLGFWLIGPLGLMGLVACRGRWLGLFPLWGFVLVYTASVVLFFVTARFRVPVLPVLMLLGAYGVQTLLQALAKRDWIRSAALLLALAVGGVLASGVPPRSNVSRAVELEKLGAVLSLQQRVDEAVATLQEAVAEDPGNAQVRVTLAKVLEQAKRLAAAEAAYRDAVRLAPGHVDGVTGLAGLLARSNRYGDAAAALERCVDVEPGRPEPWVQLALLRASAADASVRDCEKARRAGQRAVRITADRDPSALGALAAAQAECGDFDSAAATASRAVALARERGARHQLDELSRQHRLYVARRPLRR